VAADELHASHKQTHACIINNQATSLAARSESIARCVPAASHTSEPSMTCRSRTRVLRQSLKECRRSTVEHFELLAITVPKLPPGCAVGS
jgi:hypothetical protein